MCWKSASTVPWWGRFSNGPAYPLVSNENMPTFLCDPVSALGRIRQLSRLLKLCFLISGRFLGKFFGVFQNAIHIVSYFFCLFATCSGLLKVLFHLFPIRRVFTIIFCQFLCASNSSFTAIISRNNKLGTLFRVFVWAEFLTIGPRLFLY